MKEGSILQRCHRLALFLSGIGVLMVLGCTRLAVATQAGVEEIGNARFTVVTPNLIRMEYHPKGQFVDDPSIFAVNRELRFRDYRAEISGKTLTIDTGKMRLHYTDDGKPLSQENLKVSINGVKWVPGLPNRGNLGGTSRTLDGQSRPFMLDDGVLSTNGWYLLNDSRNHLMKDGWVQSRPDTGAQDWYLFGYGKDYKAALRSLTAISGSVPMPRRYALGAWYSRYWPYSSADYRRIIEEYRVHDFPMDVIVMDMDWHRDGWTGWSWNRTLLPDAEELLSWFHKQGLAVTLNLHPADGVGPHEDAYPAFMREMGEDPATKATLPFDAGDKKYMDALFKHAIVPLEKDGVDFWWLDWQQYAKTRSIPDLNNLTWLNHYFYNHTAQNDKRGISFSRWAGWGDHRNPIHFSGDAFSNFSMLAFEVPFTSTAGNMGCFFWSHDIGGHMGPRNEESYTRWCQFGALTAAMRSHSTRDATTDRRPWNYPKWAENSMRISFRLRSVLFPYIYSSVAQSCRQSIPLNRPMYLEYPEKALAYNNPQQYLFGDALLAAPVASEGVGPNRVGRQAVWFPSGDWYNLFTGERYSGSQQAMVTSDINEFPVYARGGMPIPMQPYQARMSSAPLSSLIVRCYPGEQGKTGRFTLYEDDGISEGYKRGESAETKLSYTRSGEIASMVISATKGNYKGQLEERELVVEFPCTTRASEASVDGHPVLSNYNIVTHTNSVKVSTRSIRRGCVVKVKADLVDFKQLQVQQIVRRAGLDRSFNRFATVKALLKAALPTVTSEVNRELLLASAGVGIMIRNDKPYMYPANNMPYLYVGQGLSNSKMMNWSLVDEDDAARTKLANETWPMSPVMVAPTMVTDNEPVAPSASFALTAEFKISGMPVSLSCPYTRWSLKQSKGDVAQHAVVTVSSVQPETTSVGANDGVVDGYPASPVNEWASNAEKSGAWVQLNWEKEQTVNRVWLYDRPNDADQVLSGELSFSDGSTMTVGELPNDGAGVAVGFPTKTVKWMKFTIKSVSATTQNAGLAEIAAFRVK